MERKVRWLLVGAGNIAKIRVGAALAQAPRSELAAICDVDAARAEALARQLDAPATIWTDYGRALKESGADAVYVATQAPSHVPLCLQALKAGKPFLCEKPLGLNAADARPLYEACRRSPLLGSCSNYRRLSEQYKVLAELLREKRIGEITGGYMVWSSPASGLGNTPPKRAAGGSPLKTLAFYIIDILHNLMGMPSEVFAKTACEFDPENDTEDASAVTFIFPNGALFMLYVTLNPAGDRHEVEFFGTRGRLRLERWPPLGNGPVLLDADGKSARIAAATCENWHIPMVENFIAALLDGVDLVCTVESAYRTEVITDAVFRSAVSGKTESIGALP